MCLSQIATTRLRPGAAGFLVLDGIAGADADIRHADQALQLLDADDVTIQAQQAFLIRNVPADRFGIAGGVSGNDGLPEVVRRADAVSVEEVVIAGVVVDHAAIDGQRFDVAVAFRHFFCFDPDALIERRDLRHDIVHVVGAFDVSAAGIHMIGCHQVAPIIAGDNAGIGVGGVLLITAARHVRVEVERAWPGSIAVVITQVVFVAQRCAVAAIVFECEAAIVERQHFGLGGGDGAAKDQCGIGNVLHEFLLFVSTLSWPGRGGENRNARGVCCCCRKRDFFRANNAADGEVSAGSAVCTARQ